LADLFIRAIDKELPHWPGVSYTVESTGGTHRKAIFIFNDSTRFIILPSTTRDPSRAPKNMVRDMRKELLALKAKRIDKLPPARRRVQLLETTEVDEMDVARLSISEKIKFVVPRGSEIFKHFVDESGGALSSWTFSLGANPDLQGEPYFVISKTDIGQSKRVKGTAKGTFNKAQNWFEIQITTSQFPLIANRFGTFGIVPIDLHGENESHFTFKLPAERPKLKRQKELPPPPPPAPAVEDLPETEPIAQSEEQQVVAQVEQAVAAAPQPDGKPATFILQPPPRRITIEEAARVINSSKRRLGNNLRLSIGQDGYLQIIHRIGY
jgi:hypothetical protein